MEPIEYKGLVIRPQPTAFFVTTADWGLLPGFRQDGYATLNNAKGAITKHLNATATKPASVAASSDDKAHTSVPVPAPTGSYLPRDSAARAELVSTLNAALTAFREPHKDYDDEDLEIEVMQAQSNLADFDRSHATPLAATPSRNKREGRYAGKWAGRYFRHPKARQPSADAVNVASDERTT